MLLFSSTWKMKSEHDENNEIGELLSAITDNHYRTTEKCFAELERRGVLLGNSGFSVVMLRNIRSGQIFTNRSQELDMIIHAAKEALSASVWYCYTVSGRLYFLFCYTRLKEQDQITTNRLISVQERDLASMMQLFPSGHDYRLIFSDIYFGEHGIYLAANALHHAMEYYDFITKPENLIHLNSQKQLHGAFVNDLSDYRLFAAEIAEKLKEPKSYSVEIGEEIADEIISRSSTSMESIHHHLQIFALTFTEYLGTAGIINASFFTRKHVVESLMHFEIEQQFRLRIQEMISEIQKQYARLQAVGKQTRVQDLKDYIDQNISDPNMTVSSLSEQFKISKAQISSQFRRYYGMNLYQYIQSIRVQNASKMIRSMPEISIAEIAQQAGYEDVSTMYRAFKRILGVTPSSVRK